MLSGRLLLMHTGSHTWSAQWRTPLQSQKPMLMASGGICGLRRDGFWNFWRLQMQGAHIFPIVILSPMLDAAAEPQHNSHRAQAWNNCSGNPSSCHPSSMLPTLTATLWEKTEKVWESSARTLGSSGRLWESFGFFWEATILFDTAHSAATT